MGEDASLGAPTGPGRIDDASHVLTLSRHKHGISLTAKILPAVCTREVCPWWRFADNNGLPSVALELWQLREGAPQVVFDYQKFCLAVRQQLQMLGRSQLIVERDQYSTTMKDGVGGNQPF